MDRTVAVGWCATGDTLTLDVPGNQHLLVAGVTDAGKSNTLQAIAGALAGLETAPGQWVAMVGVDLKRVEFNPWQDRFTLLAYDVPGADRLFGLLRLGLLWRADQLVARGLRKWQPGIPDMPLVYVLLDELAELAAIDVSMLAELLATDTTGMDDADIDKLSRRLNTAVQFGQRSQKARTYLLASIARLARFCGYRIISATQYPTAEVLDQQIKTQHDLRFMHRISSEEQIKVISGQTWGGLVTPDSLSVNERGSMWVFNHPHHPRPVRARSYLVDDQLLAARARATAHHRVPESVLFPFIDGDGPGLRVAS